MARTGAIRGLDEAIDALRALKRLYAHESGARRRTERIDKLLADLRARGNRRNAVFLAALADALDEGLVEAIDLTKVSGRGRKPGRRASLSGPAR